MYFILYISTIIKTNYTMRKEDYFKKENQTIENLLSNKFTKFYTQPSFDDKYEGLNELDF